MFYFIKLNHKKSNKSLYKFGVSANFEKRFSTDYDSRYGDFDIELINSIDVNNEASLMIESRFLEVRPKNIYVEQYLGMPKGYYDGLSGITEMVVLEDSDVEYLNSFIEKIKNMKGIEKLMCSNQGNAFITSGGYLSINKAYLYNTEDETIMLEGILYNIECLKANITYDDNETVFRWKPSDFTKCT